MATYKEKTDKTRMAKYAEIQAMVQKEARDVATRVYEELGTKYGVAQVPVHTHNGIDSSRVSQVDLIQNIKYASLLTIDSSTTFIVRNIPNISRLSFSGFAANNAGGGAATERAIINGETYFGKCYNLSGTGVSGVITTNVTGTPIVQGSNYMYVDSTSLANNRVGATNLYFVYAGNTAAGVVQLTVDSYRNDSLTLTSVLAAGWQITGFITLT